MRLWQAVVVRSGAVTITAVILALLVAAIGWRGHVKGQFGQLKRELHGAKSSTAQVYPPPGGQEPLVLERSALEGGSVPELLAATFLPGRGMGLLQIKAYLPGRGEVDLLDTASLEEVERQLSGKGERASKEQGTPIGSALEVPWAGGIYGGASEEPVVNAVWRGHALRLPVTEGDGMAKATGGLLWQVSSKSSQMNIMPDGGETTVSYSAGSFDGRWPSKTDVTVTAQLSERSIELKITARNTGDEPTPIGIGWNPRFAVVGGQRGNLTLHLPGSSRLEKNAHTGEPTGKQLAVAGTSYDFNARPGMRLGTISLDDTFVNLRQASLDDGPVVELRNPSADYELRMTLLSPTIKALHVTAPADGHYVAISPRFHYDDPFGREWGSNPDTGMVVLQPGQTTQWMVRVEIFSLSGEKL